MATTSNKSIAMRATNNWSFGEGLIYSEIGIQLNISAEAVRSHVKNIYEKLNVRNKTKVISKYRKWQVIAAAVTLSV